MKVDLVLEGGGVLGIAFVGAYKALREQGYSVSRVAGTSAGSLMATLIAAGFSAAELETLAYAIDFKKFSQKTFSAHFGLGGKVFSLIKNKGVYTNRLLKEWLDIILQPIDKQVFANISNLKIIASDITNRKIMILPDVLPEYGIDPKEFLVADAVQMSCAIPYYYVPYILKTGKKVHYILDGGLLSNYPIWLFDVDGSPRWPTFGIKIKDTQSYLAQNKTNFMAFSRDLIAAVINKDETIYLNEKDKVRTIIIDHDEHIKATQFNLSKKDIEYLITCGYQSTMKFLSHFNFLEYCRRFRTHNKIGDHNANKK